MNLPRPVHWPPPSLEGSPLSDPPTTAMRHLALALAALVATLVPSPVSEAQELPFETRQDTLESQIEHELIKNGIVLVCRIERQNWITGQQLSPFEWTVVPINQFFHFLRMVEYYNTVRTQPEHYYPRCVELGNLPETIRT